jgi:hypothetical protein
VAFRVFAAGEVLTAANVNDYLMEQVVIVCTSGTRPSSPGEGWTIYETDTDKILTYDGSGWVIGLEYGAWTDYSGSFTWAASGTQPAIGNGVITARYRRSGKLVYYSFRVAMGSTTTYGTGSYTFSLPVNSSARFFTGSAYLRDASAASNGHATGVCLIDGASSATTMTVASSNGGGTGTVAGQTAPFTWANTDSLTVSIVYETV